MAHLTLDELKTAVKSAVTAAGATATDAQIDKMAKDLQTSPNSYLWEGKTQALTNEIERVIDAGLRASTPISVEDSVKAVSRNGLLGIHLDHLPGGRGAAAGSKACDALTEHAKLYDEFAKLTKEQAKLTDATKVFDLIKAADGDGAKLMDLVTKDHPKLKTQVIDVIKSHHGLGVALTDEASIRKLSKEALAAMKGTIEGKRADVLKPIKDAIEPLEKEVKSATEAVNKATEAAKDHIPRASESAMKGISEIAAGKGPGEAGAARGTLLQRMFASEKGRAALAAGEKFEITGKGHVSGARVGVAAAAATILAAWAMSGKGEQQAHRGA